MLLWRQQFPGIKTPVLTEEDGEDNILPEDRHTFLLRLFAALGGLSVNGGTAAGHIATAVTHAGKLVLAVAWFSGFAIVDTDYGSTEEEKSKEQCYEKKGHYGC